MKNENSPVPFFRVTGRNHRGLRECCVCCVVEIIIFFCDNIYICTRPLASLNSSSLSISMAGGSTPKKSPATKKAGKSAGGAKKAKSSSGKIFPAGRVGRYLRRNNYHRRIGGAAPVYLAAVLEYLTAELLDLAVHAAKENKKQRVTPRAIQLATNQDEEIRGLFKNVTLASGGVVPNLRTELLKKEKKAKKRSDKGKKKDGKKSKKSKKSSPKKEGEQ